MSKSGLMLFKLNMSYLLSYFTVIPSWKALVNDMLLKLQYSMAVLDAELDVMKDAI